MWRIFYLKEVVAKQELALKQSICKITHAKIPLADQVYSTKSATTQL